MSLKDALNDAMKENGSWMEHMKKNHEIELRTQKEMVRMYSKKNDKLEKQIERLTKAFKQSKKEADKWKKYCKKAEDNLDEQMLLNEKLQEQMKELFEDIKELKRKNESLTREVINKRKEEEEEDDDDFGFCHKCNRSLTEDDFAMGKGMCESCCCEEEEKKEEEKKDICKKCKREKLSEHEFWFPVGNGEYLCCGCGMSYM